jgi:hypothetical protein
MTVRWALAACAAALAAAGATISPVAAVPLNRPPAITFLCPDTQPPQVMIDVDGTFAHRDSNWESPEVGRLLKFQCYTALGRDETNEWLMLPYGSTPAWVSRTAVRFKEGLDVTQLPEANPGAVQPAPAMRLPGVPTVSKKVQQLYKDAQKAGRKPNTVSVIGDCNSEHPVFLGRLAAGAFNLAPYPQLQKTFQAFQPSFNRASVATSGSFNAGMAFDTTWADPNVCKGNEGPLGCELRLSNASIMLISLGTGDTFTWQEFEKHYKTIIDTVLASKAVPVLMTKADDLETKQGGAPAGHINNTVRKLGAQYGLPVIDFNKAAQTLPDGGLAQERNVELQPIDPFHVNEAGMDARILMTLQTLAQFPAADAKVNKKK